MSQGKRQWVILAFITVNYVLVQNYNTLLAFVENVVVKPATL